jgi:perosamine synthetase
MSKGFIPAAKPIVGDEERAAVDAVLLSGMLAQGAEVAEFEKEFSEVLLDGRGAVAVNSGTAGLHLGLLAAGIGPGDEVIVPSFTFAATANSVALTGATPVFADIELDHYCLDVDHVTSLLIARSPISTVSPSSRTPPRPTEPPSPGGRSARSVISPCSRSTRPRT